MGKTRQPIIFFMLAVLAFVIFSFKHPFYLGVTDLKYNVKDKSLQGTVKLFTNDLEEALKKAYNVKADLINGTDKASLTTILGDYLKKNLKIKVNDKAISLAILGFEQESEAVWMYVEAGSPQPKKVELENTLLYETIKSQINIVHCEVNGVQKSYKVTNPEKDIRFDFGSK